MTRSFTLLAGLAALAGCPDATKTESGDTGSATCTTPATPAATLIDGVPTADCDASDVLTVTVNATGWVQTGGPDNEFYAIESANTSPSGKWSEIHPIDSNGNRDACGTRDQLELTIPTGGDFVPGESSLFTCDAHYNDPAVMTYAFSIDDANGVFADCVATGDDPQGLVDGNYTGINDPAALDHSLCRVENAR